MLSLIYWSNPTYIHVCGHYHWTEQYIFFCLIKQRTEAICFNLEEAETQSNFFIIESTTLCDSIRI